MLTTQYTKRKGLVAFIHSRLKILIPTLGLIIAISCEDTTTNTPTPTPTPPANNYLLSAEERFEQSGEEVSNLMNRVKIILTSTTVKNASFDIGIKGYKITYKTTYKDKTITTSGAVLLPQSTNPVGMVSIQHGTITTFAAAPSENIRKVEVESIVSDPEGLLGVAIASLGYIVLRPDYIGFGSSTDEVHPYIIEDATSIAVTSMMQAAQELALDNKITFNGRVMLAGHSEGGYATMATHKSLEANPIDGLTLIASFPSAGAYDVEAMQKYLFELNTYAFPNFIAYVAHSYQTWLNTGLSLGDMFQAPYASRIPSLFDGSKDLTQVNAELTDNIDELLVANFKNGINTEERYRMMNQLFIDNSLTNWTPKIKLDMYHGLSDTLIPYSNSEGTYNKLIERGASKTVVQLIGLDGGHADLSYLMNYATHVIENAIQERK